MQHAPPSCPNCGPGSPSLQLIAEQGRFFCGTCSYWSEPVAQQSMLYYWPNQLSSRGFAHSFFRQVPLPGDAGKGTPWCSAAGGFKHGDQSVMAGLIMAGERPNSFSQFVVESETKWLDLLRVKAEA